jgi:hypothetical protein
MTHDVNKVKNSTKIEILDGNSSKVLDVKTGSNVAMPKNDFALAVSEGEFGDFDVSEFKMIFNVISEIAVYYSGWNFL